MGLGKALLLATSLIASAAYAASDKVATGPAPSWVKPVALPAAEQDEQAEAPIQVLLADQQSRLEPGRVTTYVDVALKIQTPQGLAAGNLSFPWNPETDDITVHKLLIHRDDEVIDVLADGQTFTVLRREPNLESAMLDGVLTANIQPEGLQVGDVLEYAMTVSSSDPVLKGHVEQSGAVWNGVPFGRANLSVEWPSSMPVRWRQSGELPQVKPVQSGGTTRIALSLEDLQPIIPPRGAPNRYAMGRMIEFSDFKSWSDIGAILAPLYAEAAVIPAEGPLRNEVEKIRAASDDPEKRAEAALTLVQDRVRYVALLMGAGGLVPASAEETWARRYGDCKAKTALLLAILAELDIEAEPVVVNAISGDGIDERLPMIGLFNHVIVRAHVGGKPYWMDGTRTGDTSLARLQTPYFSWGLPLVAKDAALVRMVPDPLDRPEKEVLIAVDASNGITLPAPTQATMILRNDSALGTKIGLAQLTAAQRDEVLRRLWREQFDQLEVKSTSARYDEATGEEVLTAEGVTEMEWESGWFYPARVGLAYEPDFTRPEGSDQNAPFANDYPEYLFTRFTVKLPPGFRSDQKFSEDAVDETIAGTSYVRTVGIADNVYTVEATTRALAPEFAAKDAPTAQKALKAVSDNNVALRRPNNYAMTSAEVDAMMGETPESIAATIDRGSILYGQGRYADAIVDLSDALAKEPRNLRALTNRALAYAAQGSYDLATQDLDAASAIDAGDIVVLRGRATVARRRGELDDAVAFLSQVLKADAGDNWALEQRASAYFDKGDLESALIDNGELLERAPSQAGHYFTRARLLFALGREDEALAQAAVAIEAGPDKYENHAIAAQIFRMFGKTAEMNAALDRTLALSPKTADMYAWASGLRPRSDVEARLEDIEKALELAPDNSYFLLRKGRIEADGADYPEAIDIYSALLDKDPKNTTVLNQRGIVYAEAGDMERSNADFAAARALASDAERLNSLCYEKAMAGIALESALSECEAALAQVPDSPAVLDSRAFVLLRLGRLDEAIADFDAALSKASRLAPSLYGRAIAWSRKGDEVKAQADREAALKVDPNVERSFAGYGVTM